MVCKAAALRVGVGVTGPEEGGCLQWLLGRGQTREAMRGSGGAVPVAASELVGEGWEAGGGVAALGGCTQHLIDPRLCGATWVGGAGSAVGLEGGMGPGGVLCGHGNRRERSMVAGCWAKYGRRPDCEDRGSRCLTWSRVAVEGHSPRLAGREFVLPSVLCETGDGPDQLSFVPPTGLSGCRQAPVGCVGTNTTV